MRTDIAKAVSFYVFLIYVKKMIFSENTLLGNRVMNYVCSVTLSIFDLLTSRFATLYFSWHKWLLIISLTVLQTCRIYNSQMSKSNSSVYHSLTLFYILLTYMPKHYLVFLICRRYKIESQHIKFSFQHYAPKFTQAVTRHSIHHFHYYIIFLWINKPQFIPLLLMDI